jgi:biotin carboxyl carrier protein
MKVEIPVPAPCGGRVAAIAVAPGDHVEAGKLLLTLEA